MRKKISMMLAILAIFSIFLPVGAETVPAARPYGEPVDGTIRVLLQSLGSREALGLTLAGAYSVDGDRGFQFEPGTEIKLGVENGSIILQAGGAAIDMGGGFTLVRHLDTADKAGGAYIHESEKDTLFCGDLSFGVRNGSLRVILTIQIEDYLYGVVPYEMSDSFPIEALKAQAVAARTYAMQRKMRGSGQDYDVVDTTNDQVFKGLDVRYTRPIQAVDETRGVVGMTASGYAECFYSASNGGQTALATDVWGKGDFGYLDIRDDPYDLENPESVVKTTNVRKDATLMKEPLYALLVEAAGQQLAAGKKIGEGDAVGLAEIMMIEAINPIYGGDSRQYGTLRFTVKASIRRLTETGELGDLETTEEPLMIDLSYYDQARTALGIGINAASYELVEVTDIGNKFAISARRYGHGVGLSQRGAQWMAGQYGKSYLEILDFYYPGLELVQMTWIEKTLTRADALPESLGSAAARPTPSPSPKPLPPIEAGEYYAIVMVEGVDSTLNVRKAPGLTEPILGVVRGGSRIIVVEETEDGWAKMRTGDIEGYVSMTFIAKEGAEQVLPEATGEVQTGNAEPSAQPEATATPAPQEAVHVF